jgi:hypothetical protein
MILQHRSIWVMALETLASSFFIAAKVLATFLKATIVVFVVEVW